MLRAALSGSLGADNVSDGFGIASGTLSSSSLELMLASLELLLCAGFPDADCVLTVMERGNVRTSRQEESDQTNSDLPPRLAVADLHMHTAAQIDEQEALLPDASPLLPFRLAHVAVKSCPVKLPLLVHTTRCWQTETERSARLSAVRLDGCAVFLTQ